jgi:hypothetical protein
MQETYIIATCNVTTADKHACVHINDVIFAARAAKNFKLLN